MVGEPEWFTLPQKSGSVQAGGTPSQLANALTPAAAGLNPGEYYGEALVSAPNASNSPQSLSVVFRA